MACSTCGYNRCCCAPTVIQPPLADGCEPLESVAVAAKVVVEGEDGCHKTLIPSTTPSYIVSDLSGVNLRNGSSIEPLPLDNLQSQNGGTLPKIIGINASNDMQAETPTTTQGEPELLLGTTPAGWAATERSKQFGTGNGVLVRPVTAPQHALWSAGTNGQALLTNALGDPYWGTLVQQQQPTLGQVQGLNINQASNSTVTLTAAFITIPNSSGNVVRFVAPSVTIDIALTGINGLDTGAEAANTWYYIYAISDGTNFRGLLSTNVSTPTLPAGYTYYWNLGSVRNNASSNFVSFNQRGSRVWTTPQNVFTARAGTTAYTLESLSSFVPPTAISVSGVCGTSSDTTASYRFAADSSGTGSSAASCPNNTMVIDSIYNGQSWSTPMTTPQTIFIKMNGTGSIYRADITGYAYNM